MRNGTEMASDRSVTSFYSASSEEVGKRAIPAAITEEQSEDVRKSEAIEKPAKTAPSLTDGDASESCRSSIPADSGHFVLSSEIFPNLFMACAILPGGKESPISLNGQLSPISLEHWADSFTLLGKRFLIMECGTDKESTNLESLAMELLRGQFLSFVSSQTCSVQSLCEAVTLWSLWSSLDKENNVLIFDSLSMNVLFIGTLLLASSPNLSPSQAVTDLSLKLSGVEWAPSHKRYMDYMSRLLRLSGTFRPRPILIRQILIESCFCSDSDLAIHISDSEGCVSSNEHVVQFYDDESHSLAIHFPNFKSRLVQSDVCIELRSRRSSTMVLQYRFNTAFVDNLISSSIAVPLDHWDKPSGVDVVFPSKFLCQIITAPATNATAQPIVVPPYQIDHDLRMKKHLMLRRHVVNVNQRLINHFSSNRSGFDSLDVSLALKFGENDIVATTEILRKFFSISTSSSGLRRLSAPIVKLRGDGSPLLSGGSPAELAGTSNASSIRRDDEFKSLDGSPMYSIVDERLIREVGKAGTGEKRLVAPTGGISPGPPLESERASVPPVPSSPPAIGPSLRTTSPPGPGHAPVSSSPSGGPPSVPSVMFSSPPGQGVPSPMYASSPGQVGGPSPTGPSTMFASPPPGQTVASTMYASPPGQAGTPSTMLASPPGQVGVMLASPPAVQGKVSSPPPLPSGKAAAPPPVPRPPSMGKASPPSLPPKVSTSASPPQGKASPPSMVVGGAPPVPLSFKKASPAMPSTSPKDEDKKSLNETLAAESQPKEPLPLGRKLHWKPIRNVESTIWATLEHEPVSSSLTKMTDFSGLKSVFDDSESVSQRRNSLAKIGGPAGNPANHVVTLLEGKRAQNIGVVVARVPIELLTTRLTSLDTDSLSIENLERIKMILPTEEETLIFSQFKGEVSSLRDIEQKVIGLFKLPRLSQRIKFCLVSLQLPATMNEVVAEIELLRKCANQVRQSKKLKKVLHVVLMLGNYLNRGETRGFSIESLSKLAEFKSSSDPGITTMHFLAARLLATDPSLTELIEEMPTLREVNRVTPESISQGVLIARNDAESIKNELKVHANHYSAEAGERMKKFLTSVEPRIQILVADWSACEKDLVELRKFFGEDPKKISVEDFYGYLRNFCDSLLNAATELKKRPKKFEKILAGSGSNSPQVRKTPSPPPPVGKSSTTWGKITTDELVEASKKLKSKESVPGPVKVARASSGTDWNVVEKPSSPSQVKLRSNFPSS